MCHHVANKNIGQVMKSGASTIYGLDGQRRTQMQRGLNIVRKDGKAVKLISK